MTWPDSLMTPEEVLAVRTAITTELNPTHLFGFAGTLYPDHCTSASVIHARGQLLERRRSFDVPALQLLLDAVVQAAFAPSPSATPPQALVRARTLVDATAHRLRIDPRQLHRAVRRAAGDLVVDEHAQFHDLPQPVAALARQVVLTLGPVRVLDADAVRVALPPCVALATPEEQQQRATWVRHYLREARRVT